MTTSTADREVSLPPAVVAAFTEIVGEANTLVAPSDIAPFLLEPRGLYQGYSPLILQPATTKEVAAICRLASAESIAIVPQGGNTGLVGGQTPHRGEVVVSLRRMNNIREIDLQSNTMTCEAGVILANARSAAAEVHRLFPLQLASEGSCTIGGNLATNAGGNAALAYGMARDLVVGLEVVLADGRILSGLSKLKKDNTGYDLKNLFIGSEGTLGIITAATLKLFPEPHTIAAAFVALPSIEAALELLALARGRAGGSITAFELIGEMAFDISVRHSTQVRDPFVARHPWYVLMEFSGHDDLRPQMERALEEAIARGLVRDAVLAESLEQRAAFWRLREFIPDAQRAEGGSIKHDISVPVAAVPDFVARASAAVTALIPGCRPCPFGHLGDGNIHFNVSQPPGADKNAFIARWGEMNAVVHRIVVELGGSISAEHGIGVLKRDLLVDVKDPVTLDLMRTIKRTLDPANILNPGKVV